MRYALCNEMFEGWDFARVCQTSRAIGYTGLEVAPFTLAPLITDVSAARRQELRQQAEAADIHIIGLHWLLAKTTGFHLTSPDPAIRQRTGLYLAELARAAADLGGDILVLGSPAQRKIPDGFTRDQADDFAVDTIRHCLPALEQTGVKLCLEPLTPAETDFWLTASEAVGTIRKLQHPNVKLHLDVKAMSAEPHPTPEVIRANSAHTYHFHANDPTDAPRYGPGFGTTDLKPIFQALRDTNYSGWVSVEVFHYAPDPETIARRAIEFMRSCE
jgi:sugar phosphate isomerase/epimerase